MSAAKSGSALASYGVYFVYEDYARGILLGFFKKIPHTRSSYTYKHFYEFRTGNMKERHIGFTGHGAGKQSFSHSRAAQKQNTFRNFCAQGQKLLREA